VRKEDLETGDVPAGPAQTPEGDGASVFLNYALADPQAKASALCRLGGEKRLKEMPGVLDIDADTGIADRNASACAPTIAAGGGKDMQPELASFRHGLYRIADEIEEDLLQLHREALDQAPASISFHDGDLAEFQAAQLQFEDVVEQLRD
jgi:hypothetical protein